MRAIGFIVEERGEMNPEVALVAVCGRVFAALVMRCLISRLPTSSMVIRSMTGVAVTSAVSLRSLDSAIVRVSPSRLPGLRIGPSLRVTGRPLTRHWPYPALRFWKMLPVPYWRLAPRLASMRAMSSDAMCPLCAASWLLYIFVGAVECEWSLAACRRAE